jgi:hypothetical protein
MAYPIRVPEGYQPFRELELCSNTLQNVLVPIAVDRAPVFLVGLGQGPLPRVWLAARTDPSGWMFVVQANRPSSTSIRVISDAIGSSVKVVVGGKNVAFVTKESEERVRVDFLDLRPLGLDVSGTAEGLRVGGTQLVSNKLLNLEVAVALNLQPRST